MNNAESLIKAKEWIDDLRENVDIEIGFGSGKLLLKMAENDIHRKFIGIEIQPLNCLIVRKKLKRKKLKNLVILHRDAKGYMKSLDAETISNYHIYFPSPYPSKKYTTSNLFEDRTLFDIHRTLRPGGKCRIVTDDKKFFSKICELITPYEFWIQEWSDLNLNSISGKYFVGTFHEKKYRSQGKFVYSLLIQK